jgi:hypothetical protein
MDNDLIEIPKGYRIPTLEDVKVYIKKELFDEDEWIYALDNEGVVVVAYLGILDKNDDVRFYYTDKEDMSGRYLYVVNTEYDYEDLGFYNISLIENIIGKEKHRTS